MSDAGMFSARRAFHSGRGATRELFDTLRALAANLGSKTDTAASLGIHRQTFYQRFERITGVLGPLEPGSARIGAVLTAVFLEQARREAAAAADAKREGSGRANA